VRRRLKIEVERIANIERKNFVSLPRNLIGYAGEVADRVANIFQTGGWRNLAKVRHRHEGILTAETPSTQRKATFMTF
jgi:hypothetical protein